MSGQFIEKTPALSVQSDHETQPKTRRETAVLPGGMRFFFGGRTDFSREKRLCHCPPQVAEEDEAFMTGGGGGGGEGKEDSKDTIYNTFIRRTGADRVPRTQEFLRSLAPQGPSCARQRASSTIFRIFYLSGSHSSNGPKNKQQFIRRTGADRVPPPTIIPLFFSPAGPLVRASARKLHDLTHFLVLGKSCV